NKSKLLKSSSVSKSSSSFPFLPDFFTFDLGISNSSKSGSKSSSSDLFQSSSTSSTSSSSSSSSFLFFEEAGLPFFLGVSSSKMSSSSSSSSKSSDCFFDEPFAAALEGIFEERFLSFSDFAFIISKDLFFVKFQRSF